MSFVLDTGPLAEALRLKIQASTRGMEEIVNKAARDVTLRTIQFSPMVDAAVIAAQLTQVIGMRTHAKSGRALRRPRAITKPSDLARAIVISRLFKKGVNPHTLSGAEIDEAVRKLVTARKRSAGFLKSGFVPAARLFGAPSTGGTLQFGPDRGTGKLATPNDLFATIENDVPNRWRAGARAYPEAEMAIQRAMDFVAADILVYVDRKLRNAGFA